MALYTRADSSEVSVVSKDVSKEMVCNLCDCEDLAVALEQQRRVEIWPKAYQLKQVKGSNGVIYKYDIYVNEEGLLKRLDYNEIATLIMSV